MSVVGRGIERLGLIAVAASLVLPVALQARVQEPDWPRHELPPLMEESREIAIALSAAPPHISESAAVWVLRRGGFHKVREGANGFTCMVDRYWTQAIEPICFNPEASATVLPVLLLREELRENGSSLEEIDSAIEAGFAQGKFRVPERFAVGYMFSSAQDLYSDTGTHHGSWVPHIMVFVPYLTRAEAGGRGVFRPGRWDAAFFAIIPGFIDPEFEEQQSADGQ